MERILLAVGEGPGPAAYNGDGRNRAGLLPATVLAGWFGAPLQFICRDPGLVEATQELADGLGIPVSPTLALDEPFNEALAAHAHEIGPSLIVTSPSPGGLALAAISSQPVLLAAERPSSRMPSEAIVVEITGEAADYDALAVAATSAQLLELPIRLVVADRSGSAMARSDGPAAHIADAEVRLTEMGCEVATDLVDGGTDHPAVIVGKTRGAPFVIISQSRLDAPNLIDQALTEGVNLLVAPAGRTADPGPTEAPLAVRRRHAQDRTSPADGPAAATTLEVLPRRQCFDHLSGHTIGRLGYVDAGWPVIVPVNYRIFEDSIVIRSVDGAKLRAAERGEMFCFEADGYNEQYRSGWSVVAHGRIEPVDDPAVLRAAWANDPQPWVTAQRWRWLRMVPIAITGRRAEQGTHTTQEMEQT